MLSHAHCGDISRNLYRTGTSYTTRRTKACAFLYRIRPRTVIGIKFIDMKTFHRQGHQQYRTVYSKLVDSESKSMQPTPKTLHYILQHQANVFPTLLLYFFTRLNRSFSAGQDSCHAFRDVKRNPLQKYCEKACSHWLVLTHNSAHHSLLAEVTLFGAPVVHCIVPRVSTDRGTPYT